MAARALPDGAVGVVDKVEGILLRFNGDKREWERIADGTPLAASDRLLSLAPFRSRIVIAKTPVTLIGETDTAPGRQDHGRRPGLRAGRRPGPDPRDHLPASPAEGGVRRAHGDHRSSVEWDGGTRESHPAGTRGSRQLRPLRSPFYHSDGELKLTLDQAKETLAGPGTLIADSSGRLQASPDRPLPAWMTEAEPSDKERKLGEQFLQQFSPDRPVLADLVGGHRERFSRHQEAGDLRDQGDRRSVALDSHPDPRERPQRPPEHRRGPPRPHGRGPQGRKPVRDQLDAEFGEQTGRVIEKLLIGYGSEDASKRETHQHLVDLLSPRDHPLVVRELALENLKTITGRGNEGYDPEKPDEKRLNAWKSLLSKGELKPAGEAQVGRLTGPSFQPQFPSPGLSRPPWSGDCLQIQAEEMHHP